MKNEIIMNEIRFVEEEIITDKININSCKSYDTIKYVSLWVRYITQTTEMTKQEVWEYFDKYLASHLEKYNRFKWREIIENTYDKGCDYPLHNIDGIAITQHEMNCLIKIKGIMAQKIMFTILVLSKFYNLFNKENNDWCNTEHDCIKKLANFSGNMDRYYRVINKFYKDNLVKLAIKSNNIGCNYDEFSMLNETKTVDTSIAVTITDIKNLGLQYMYHHKRYYKNVGVCKTCGNYFYRKTYHTLYCNMCRKY